MNDDTVKLLRECDAGLKMGDGVLKEVMDSVKNPKLKSYLNHCKDIQGQLGQEIAHELAAVGDKGKELGPMAKSMSWIKTNVKLLERPNEKTAVDLITDGCHMGIKSLCRYINEYKTADEKAVTIARKIVAMEEQLAHNLRPYL